MKVLMKGNEALAEAAIRAGCRHFFGYPITPQTELAAYMAKRMPMVLGASAAGVRAMTSSSSPGISLKSEGISYMAGSDLPGLIINVQRGGPGLGGIQPSQADYWQATKATGHGDFQILVFAPSTVQEMVDLVSDAFDAADRWRMPAMILADGMLGQMMEPVSLPEEGQAQMVEKPWAACGHGNQREHNIINSLYLTPDKLEELVMTRYHRYQLVKEQEQRAEEYLCQDADLVLVAYGASARVARSAVTKARQQGYKVGLVRPISLWPFPVEALNRAAAQAKSFLVVEMSMGQMVEDVKLAIQCKIPVHFYGRTGGMIPTPAQVLEDVERILENRESFL